MQLPSDGVSESTRERALDPLPFGAAGDGQRIDTAALQAALDAAAARARPLRLTPGRRFRSGALFLRSGSTLEIPAGTTLLGSTDLADYPLIDTRVAGIEMRWPAALLNAIDAERVRIHGEGLIDGDGAGFWAAYWALRATYEPRGLRWAADYDARRPRLVLLQNVRDAFIGGGLRLRRSGFWTLQILYSERVRVDRLTIRNNDDGRGPSTDGVDVDSSCRVLLRRVDIAVNDDALVIKAGRDADGLRVNRPTRDVLIADCRVREGSTGIAFGSETSGGFERVRVRRLQIDAAVPVGVLFKSARTRGGFGRDLRLSDVRCDGVAVPLRIGLNWNPAYSLAVLPEAEAARAPAHWLSLCRPVPPQAGLMRLHDLRLVRLVARGARSAFEVDADPAAPIGLLRFEHCDIEAGQGGHLLDLDAAHFRHCALRLGSPVVLQREGVAEGLPACRIDPHHPRRDVSAQPMHLQDLL